MQIDNGGCLTGAIYGGAGECPTDLGKLLGIIAVPRGTRYDRTQVSALQANLETLLTVDNRLERGALIGPFAVFTNNTAEPVTETFDFGAQVTLGNSAYLWQVRMVENGICDWDTLSQTAAKKGSREFLLVFAARNSGNSYYIVGKRYFNTATSDYGTQLILNYPRIRVSKQRI